MFVKTVKVKSILKVLLCVLAIAGVLLLILTAINRFTGKNQIMLEGVPEQVEFLNSLGWQVSSEPIDTREVTVPKEWNAVFEEYNDLQKQQGFDLEKYKGKQAWVYTYQILNYDGGRENVVANLMISDGRLIAGDVSLTELGGFMQGLCKIN